MRAASAIASASTLLQPCLTRHIIAQLLRKAGPMASDVERLSTALRETKLESKEEKESEAAWPLTSAPTLPIPAAPCSTLVRSVAAVPSCTPTSLLGRQPYTPDVVSIAPMMEWTTRHYRYMMRMLTKKTRLYTEMVVDRTLIYSKIAESFLLYHPDEHPVVCQLGGSEPEGLAKAAKMVEAAGYDEINLNCGCPSDKVAGKGCFGAALMKTPEVVRDCVAAMKAVVSIPVSVKCRLGVDDIDSYEAFSNFLRIVSSAGCSHFIVHARKCILRGLSTKDNRTIPPLRYHWVQRAAMDFPHLRISLNGGVSSLAQAERLLRLQRGREGASAPVVPEDTPLAADGFPIDTMLQVDARVGLDHSDQPAFGDEMHVLDSVMVGRMAYHDPWAFADIDRALFGVPNPGLTRRQVLDRYLTYMDEVLASLPEAYRTTATYRPMEFAKPLINLFHGEVGGAKFRSTLSHGIGDLKQGVREALADALTHIPDEVLDAHF